MGSETNGVDRGDVHVVHGIRRSFVHFFGKIFGQKDEKEARSVQILHFGAADEVVRAHLQTHGEMPRAVVIDLWGSATLRTGGEEIAQGLALTGCKPIWARRKASWAEP